MVEKMKQTNPLFPGWEEASSIDLKSPSIEESPESPSLFFYNDLSKILLPPPRSSSSSLSGGSRGSAFQEYNVKKKTAAEDHRRRESLMKKGIVFYRKLKIMRVGERIETRRPASAQLLHMIAEKRRREKLNESFFALRSILPPETKVSAFTSVLFDNYLLRALSFVSSFGF